MCPLADPVFPIRITNPNETTYSERALRAFARSRPHHGHLFNHHDWGWAMNLLVHELYPERTFEVIEIPDPTTAFVDCTDGEFVIEVITSGSWVDQDVIEQLAALWERHLLILSTTPLTAAAKDLVTDLAAVEYAVINHRHGFAVTE